MKKVSYILSALVLPLIILLSCTASKNEDESTTKGLGKVYCDQSFENILEQEIEVFENTYPNANILAKYMDETAAIDSLIKMKVQLIITAHKLDDDQVAYLKSRCPGVRQQQIAVDAIALITNPANDIEELSMRDIRDIFSGKIKCWGEIEPTKLKKDSIIVVFDNQGSSVTRFMRDSVLNGEKFLPNVYAQGKSQDVFEVVKKKKNALGLIGVSWITSDMKSQEEQVPLSERVAKLNENDTTVIDFNSSKFKVLKVRRDDQIEGYKPYQAYIYDARYPLYRSVFAISTSSTKKVAHGFYCFVTGFIGQKIILNTGILPAIIQPRVVEVE